MDETYNGYKNYETWCTALWINNDEGLYNQRQDLSSAEQVELWIESMRYEENEMIGLFADLLSRSIARIDWQAVYDATKQE